MKNQILFKKMYNLHVDLDINFLHIYIIILHVDIIYLACRGRNMPPYKAVRVCNNFSLRNVNQSKNDLLVYIRMYNERDVYMHVHVSAEMSHKRYETSPH